jgi:glycosyltransferase involved in cell wall biosynthesis
MTLKLAAEKITGSAFLNGFFNIKMKNIKVIYIRTQFWFDLKAGGSVSHTIGVLNGIIKNGCKLNVVSNEKFLGIDDLEFSIIKPLKLRPHWMGELLYNFYAGSSLRESIAGFKPDFIYHRYTGYTYFVTALAKRMNVPLILEFNSFDTWKLKYWEKSKNVFKRLLQRIFLYNIVRKIEGYNLKNASLIVTVSKTLERDLLALGIPQDKIFVNPNGFDPEKFGPERGESNRVKEIRRKFDASGKKFIIGFSGTFGLWHGIPQLIEAIDRILGKKKNTEYLHFLIIGEGSQLKDKVKSRLLKYDGVTFTGMIPYSEIQYYLGACDILLSPHNPPLDSKEFFGSPTKLFEYMAMGKGIVASDIGQIGEILEDGRTAVLVKPGSVEDLVNGIIKLAYDKKLRLRLGRNAAREAREKYTWDRNIRRLLDFLIKSKILS